MIRNSGFELPDASYAIAGLALYWEEETVGTGEESADFATEVAGAFVSTEGFEVGWITGTQRFVQMLAVENDRLFETFERWLRGIEFFIVEPSESAAFGGAALSIEGFDVSWGPYEAGFTLTSESGLIEPFDWAVFRTSQTSTPAVFENSNYAERFFATEWPALD